MGTIDEESKLKTESVVEPAVAEPTVEAVKPIEETAKQTPIVPTVEVSVTEAIKEQVVEPATQTIIAANPIEENKQTVETSQPIAEPVAEKIPIVEEKIAAAEPHNNSGVWAWKSK